jgi:hypothetical protein
MSAEDRDDVARGLAAAVDAACAAASAQLQDEAGADCIRIAELALRGIHGVPWRPPGPAVPVCPCCGRTDGWIQRVPDGTVRCLCALIDQTG